MPLIKKIRRILNFKNKPKLYWLLIFSYLLYSIYSVIQLIFSLNSQFDNELNQFDYLFLDGLRLLGFLITIKLLMLYGLIRQYKSAYFLVLTEMLFGCSYFFISNYRPELLISCIIITILCLINWKSFDLYHAKYNLERRLLIVLSTFVTLQFIQSFGFRLLRSSFDSRFHFLQLITDYLKLLVDPSTLAGLDQVEPKSATAWIFLYLVLFAGALFIILSITLIVIPRISLNNDDLKWNQNPDTRELDIDTDPLAVYKVTQNLDVFYFENITLFYKETATTCFVLGEPIIHDSTDVNLKETITLLKNMMHKKGKSVCFYQLSDKYFTYFKSQNFASINYADEAIIDHSIDLAKPVYKSLRYSHNRLKKENINVIIKCFKDLDKTDFVNFNALKKVWQESNGYQESQFTSGYDLFSKDIDGYLVILSNPNNDILVMYTFLPFGTDQDKSLTLDYILRHPSANSSITEGGLVYSINYFIDKEFTSVSLGLAPNPKIENEYIYKLSKILNIKYNSSGLRNFKQKFLPRWECRYLYLEGFQHISTIYPELQKLMYKEK